MSSSFSFSRTALPPVSAQNSAPCPAGHSMSHTAPLEHNHAEAELTEVLHGPPAYTSECSLSASDRCVHMLHTWTTTCLQRGTFCKPLKLVPYKSICFHNHVLKHSPNNNGFIHLRSTTSHWMAGFKGDLQELPGVLQKRSAWDHKQGSQGRTAFTYWAAPPHSSYCRAGFSSTATGRHCTATAGPPASLLKTCNSHTAIPAQGTHKTLPRFALRRGDKSTKGTSKCWVSLGKHGGSTTCHDPAPTAGPGVLRQHCAWNLHVQALSCTNSSGFERWSNTCEFAFFLMLQLSKNLFILQKPFVAPRKKLHRNLFPTYCHFYIYFKISFKTHLLISRTWAARSCAVWPRWSPPSAAPDVARSRQAVPTAVLGAPQRLPAK